MSVKRLTLTDEDYRALCDSLPQGAGYRDLADAAVAFGESRGLQRAADHMAATYGRCNLLTGTGYRNGDEVFDHLDREREGGGDVQR